MSHIGVSVLAVQALPMRYAKREADLGQQTRYAKGTRLE